MVWLARCGGAGAGADFEWKEFNEASAWTRGVGVRPGSLAADLPGGGICYHRALLVSGVWMGVVDFAAMVGAVEKVRSIVASHAHQHKGGGGDGDGEARRRYQGEGAPRPRSPESRSAFEPPTPPRARAPDARSGTKGDAAPCSPPPCRDIR